MTTSRSTRTSTRTTSLSGTSVSVSSTPGTSVDTQSALQAATTTQDAILNSTTTTTTTTTTSTAPATTSPTPSPTPSTTPPPAQFTLIAGPVTLSSSSAAFLGQALAAANAHLQALALRSDRATVMRNIFGLAGTDSAVFEANLLTQLDLLSRGAGIRLQLRSSAELGNASGAYCASDASGQEVIFLNADRISSGALTLEQLTSVLVEEFGHMHDYRLNNGGDSAGDEGEQFAATVTGRTLSAADQTAIGADSDGKVLEIDGTALLVEQAVTFGGNTASVTFTEGGAAVSLQPSLTFARSSSLDDINGFRITVASATTADWIRVNGTISNQDYQLTVGASYSLNLRTYTGGLTATSGSYRDVSWTVSVSGGVITFTQGAWDNASKEYNAEYLTRRIQFFNTSQAPGTAGRTVTWQVNEDGAWAASVAQTLTVTAANDPAVVTVGASPLAGYSEQAAAATLAANLTISDVDSANLTGAAVSISGGFTSGDVLSYTYVLPAGMTGTWNASTGVLTFAGSATLATYQAILRTVQFRSTSNDPTAISATRTIGWVVNDGVANSTAVTSSFTVTPVNDAATGTLAISGTVAEGATVSANTSGISDPDGGISSWTYQWQSSADGVTWTNIAGATAASYAIPSDQSLVDARLRLTATGTDARGGSSAFTSAATVVANVDDAATATVSVSGTSQEGASLTASLVGASDPDGTITATAWQWQSSSDGGTSWANLAGATAATYTIPSDQSLVGLSLRARAITTDSRGGSSTFFSTAFSVANVNDAVSGSLTFSGTVAEGGTVTAVTSGLSDEDGALSFSGYQWEQSSNGTTWTAISGATAASYTIPSDQSLVGQRLRVRVVATDPFGNATTVTSAGSIVANVDDAATGSLSFSGTAQEGATLTAVTSAISDADGALTFTYQWQQSADGISWTNIAGATAATYAIPADQSLVGRRVRLTAVSTDALGGTSSFTSAGSVVANVNDPVSGSLAVSGSAAEGGTLSADTSALSDEDGALTFTYQWQQSADGTSWTNIAGATAATFAIPSDQSLVGQRVRLTAVATDPFGNTASLSSAGSVVANVDDAVSGSPSFSGSPSEGATLTAVTSAISDPDGALSFSYRWQSSSDGTLWTNIAGATAASYTIPSDQSLVGSQIRLAVVATDPFGASTTLVSSAGSVANVDDAALGSLAISGSVAEGASVSADVSTIRDVDNRTAPTNLLVNGSFETTPSSVSGANYGVLAGWTPINAAMTEYWVNWTAANAPATASDGQVRVEIDYASAVDGIAQSLQTSAGQAYDLYFDLAHRGASGSASLEVYWNGSRIDGGSVVTSLNSEWTTFRLSVTGSGGLDELRFLEPAAENTGVSPLLDNVRLYATEPSDPGSAPSFTYQWQRSADGATWTNIAGATAATYAIPSDQSLVGQRIRLTATSTDGRGGTTSFTSAGSLVANVDDPATGVPTLSGSVQEGATVSAVTSAISDPDGSLSFTYQWQASSDGGSSWSNLSGATAASYAIPSDQSLVGQQLRVRVVTTDALGGSTTLTSAGSTVANVNDPISGSLSFSGTAQEGGSLSAVTSGLTDPDGALSFSYQWQQSTDGTNWSNIAGATATPYAIPSDQSLVGRQIRLSVVATDPFGNSSSLSSAAATVANVNDPTTGSLAFSGSIAEGGTVSAVTSGLSDEDGALSFTYQWQQSVDGSTWSSIPGATGASYTIPSDQSLVDRRLRLTAVATDPFGNTASFSSAAAIVANVDDAATGSLTLSGTALPGATLAAVTSSISDPDGALSFTYQWQRSSDGASWTNIAGATGASYAIPSDGSLVGQQLRLTAVATDTRLGTTSFSSAATPVNNLDGTSSNVSISGTAAEGGSLTASISGVANAAAATYRWQRLVSGSWSDISGATSATFAIPSDQSLVDVPVRVIVAVPDGSGASTPYVSVSQTVVNVDDAATGALSFSGSAAEGGTLDAVSSAISDPDGSVTFSYQWESSGDGGATWNAIPGADASPYTIPSDQSLVGQRIRLRAISTDARGGSTNLVSADALVANVNDPATGTLSFSGTAAEGATLSADTTGLSDPDGALTFSYQWQRSADGVSWSNIAGATAATYALPSDQSLVGQRVRLTVVASDPFGNSAPFSSGSAVVANVDDAATGSLSFTGSAAEGATLTADTSALSDPDGALSFTYRWQSSADGVSWSDLIGATGTSFAIPSDQSLVGRRIRLTAVSTDALGGTTSHVSAASVIANVDDAATGTLAFSGTAAEGGTLSADTAGLSDPDGALTFTYQWQRSADGVSWTPIAGATGASYTLPSDQSLVGQRIRLTAVSTDAYGGTTSHSSAASVVANVDDALSGSLALSGSAVEGATLTADTSGLSDPDGTLSFSYQWQSSSDGGSTWSGIPGAVTASYTLPTNQSLVGRQVRLRAVATDPFGASTVLVSPGAVVDNLESEATGSLLVSGTAEEGGTLSVDASGVSDVDGAISLAYQWQSSSDGGTTWSPIAGASAASYAIPSDQSLVGLRIRVRVTSTDPFGGTTDLFSAAQTVANVQDAASGGSLSVSGSAAEGGSLVASLSGISDPDGPLTLTYQWQENVGGSWQNLAGASAATLSIPSDQSFVGKVVRVVATATDPFGGVSSFSSDALPIGNVQDAATGTVTFTGTARQGGQLQADTSAFSDPDGPLSFTYQWQSSADGGLNWSDVPGATAASLAIANAQSQVGLRYRVRISGTDPFGAVSSLTSAAQTVADVDDAPVLDPNASPALTPIAEDPGLPQAGSTAGSTLVSSLLGGVSDVDGEASGIAVVGVNGGSLWTSTDNGASWTEATAISDEAALLLPGSARLWFRPFANFEGVIADAISFRAWDTDTGSAGPGRSLTAPGLLVSDEVDAASLTVSGVNDRPVLSGNVPSLAYVENAAASLIDAFLTVSDADTPADLDGGWFEAAITAGAGAGDRLGLRSVGNGAGQISVSGRVVSYEGLSIGLIDADLDGNAGRALRIQLTAGSRLAAVQALGRAITFASDSETPATSPRTISFQLNDGGRSGAGGALSSLPRLATVTVEAVNDAPVAAITPTAYSITRDTNYLLHGTGLAISDADAGSNTVSAQLAVGIGSLNVNAGSTGVLVSNSGTAAVQLQGSISQINALLAGSAGASVVYRYFGLNSGFNTNLSLSVNDGGQSGSGGSLSGSDSATIQITQQPTLTIGNVSVSESSPFAVLQVLLSNTATAPVGFRARLESGTALVHTAVGSGADTAATPSGAALEYWNGSAWLSATNGVTVAAGASSVFLRTAIAQDSQLELAETFRISLDQFSGPLANSTPISGTVTIRDDGTNPTEFRGSDAGSLTAINGTADNDTPTLRLSTVTVSEASPFAVIRAWLQASNGQEVSTPQAVSFSPSLIDPGVQGGGVANILEDTSGALQFWSGSQWVAVNASNPTVSIAAGASSVLLRTGIVNDAAYEIWETFRIASNAVSGPVRNRLGTGSSDGVVTIVDDGRSGVKFFSSASSDANGSTVVADDDRSSSRIEVGSIELSEASDFAVVEVRLTARVATAISYRPQVVTEAGGASLQEAGAGEIQWLNGSTWTTLAPGGRVPLAANTQSQLLRVRLLNDTEIEVRERFGISVNDVYLGTSGTTPAPIANPQGATGYVTLVDDGSMRAGYLSSSRSTRTTNTFSDDDRLWLSISDAEVEEPASGTGFAVVTVQLRNSAGNEASAKYDLSFQPSLIAGSGSKAALLSGPNADAGQNFEYETLTVDEQTGALLSSWTPVTGPVTLHAGEDAIRLRVSVRADALNETSESFQIGTGPFQASSLPVGATTGSVLRNPEGVTGTVTIANISLPVLRLSNATASEGGQAEFTVSLADASNQLVSGGIATPVSFVASLVGGSATLGTDIASALEVSFNGGGSWSAVTAGAVTLPANTSSLRLRVAIPDDAANPVYEGAESFSLRLDQIVGAVANAGFELVGTGTISDDLSDLPSLGFRFRNGDGSLGSLNGTANVMETSGFLYVRAALDRLSAFPVRFTPAAGTGTAALGSDVGSEIQFSTAADPTSGAAVWQSAADGVEIAAGSSGVWLRVQVIDDEVFESNETFVFTTTGSIQGAGGSPTATATILANDQPQIQIGNVTVSEGSPYAVIEVTLSTSSPSQEVRFNPTVEPGSAQATDYGTVNGTTLEMLDPTNPSAGWQAVVNGFQNGAPTGVRIAPGSRRILLRVPVRQDALYEGSESFTISTGEVGGPVSNSAGVTGTVTIVDDGSVSSYFEANSLSATPLSGSADDDRPQLSVSSVTLSEASGYAIVEVSLSNASSQPISFSPSLAGAASGASATIGSGESADVLAGSLERYTGTGWVSVAGGSVTIPAGSTSVLLRVALQNDAASEGSESFQIQTGAVSGPSRSAGGASGTVTVRDDGLISAVFTADSTSRTPSSGTADRDVEVWGSLSATLLQNGAETGLTSVIFRVSRALLEGRSDSETRTITYTLGGTAVAGSDYEVPAGYNTGNSRGTVTLAPGATSADVTIAVLDDLLVDGNRSLSLRLLPTESTENYTLAVDTAVASIADNDVAVVESDPQISIESVAVTETDLDTVPDNFASLRVTLSKGSSRTITVDWTTTAAGSEVEAARRATAGGDYTTSSGTLTFTPGVTTQTIRVPILRDNSSESTELFYVDLTNPSNATLDKSRGTIEINDNDATKGLTIDNSSNALTTLNGGEFDDVILGGSINETILGDPTGGNGGADQITGGLGGDVITGGPGADRFLYPVAAHSLLQASGARTYDHITDFTPGNGASGDRILLDQSLMPSALWNRGSTSILNSSLQTAISTAFTDRGDGSALGANQALLFSFRTNSLTRISLLVVNDGTAGFDRATDMVFQLGTASFAGSQTSGSLTVSDWFSTL